MMLPDWRPPTLTTSRLTLRPFSEADAVPLFEYAQNPNVTRFTLWEAHRNIAETLTFVREYALIRYREGMAEPYAITLTPDPKPIGSCGCFWASRPNQSMELGYWLAEPFWGRGLAVEACRALVDHVFREYAPERLQARVIAGNVASSRVLDKLGFRFEGTLRSGLFRREKFEDLHIYSLLRAEWTIVDPR
ncbi:MAG TPA: GNAT family protein [Gemmata sp.]|jgi:ribosomal-protein-alanine N-acetyltransferase|nr:GNAT family protein [Gemmata sp.]